jgi:maltose O-acetyltransferase
MNDAKIYLMIASTTTSLNSQQTTLLLRPLIKAMHLKNHLCWRWYRLRFMWIEAATLHSFSLGEGAMFYVPVCVAGGAGRLTIGARNKFGFGMAHRLGSGEIMLQPRAAGAQIILGEGNWFNNNAVICANEFVSIGNNCVIGDQVAVYDCDFHEINPKSRNCGFGPTSPVSIGNNVWLGSRVMVLKGVTIGDNSVVGAMSLVTKSIPANSVAAGIPARVVRQIRESG